MIITIAVVTVSILIIIGAIVAAIVISLVYVKKSSGSGYNPRYFRGSFRILDRNYSDDYKDSDNFEYRMLAAQIEGILEETFKNSELKAQYNMSKVIGFR
ncbi:hypothetical protein GDO78_012222 [Eleutherodactylus coqui]|uniref:SEA domain-containing protein n=1 Tax=Eleutherodactylus coqui TaxID=57060 RepID=A0A8J6F362_ELECQ|nr:hypothetical protein GDO78_012222 [Eleutherodactylus coqui]